MAYKFAKQSEVKELESWCMDILHAVQEEVRDYFTFDIRLIGSGDKRLVTQNSDESFDLDYNIILQRDKKGLLNNPKQIKDIFVSRFNKILKECVSDYTHTCDSTSVITVKLIRNNKLHFSFDVAIVVEGDDGLFYRLINDKSTGRYIWNQVKQSSNYFERFNLPLQFAVLNKRNQYYETTNCITDILRKQTPCGIRYSSCYLPMETLGIVCSDFNVVLYKEGISKVKFIRADIKTNEQKLSDVDSIKIVCEISKKAKNKTNS